ncbi:MAG TPA: class I SAM-dependent methyltransferase [Acidimicrobiales bacterium]|jgi:SAM-dependent methyltransferase|nr:class I SAM-dependent methyltransferase [Acidimicrobiales bacterium]
MHDDRRRAESFGLAAERYDRSRPTYPDGLLDAVVGSDPGGLDVLDVGCGTGISSRLLAARGARVLGVEADERMAEVARNRGTRVEVGRIEGWDPAGRTFDRVTAAQAWHWVDPYAGAVKAARILRPGGRLCLFWNIGNPPEDVAAALDEVYDRLAPGTDSYSVALGYAVDKEYRDEKDGIRSCPDLTDPVDERFPWSRRYTTAEWLDQLPTHSDHATMEPALLGHVLDAVAGVVDGFGGSFEMRYSTLLISATRT